jgi:L-lysine exporter family protein LysE/ArgO
MFSPIVSSPSLSAWASGTATGLGLFAVVGAQSAFILRQGILRTHVLSIALTCALADAVLIFASVLGLQTVLSYIPGASDIITIGGVAFLAFYGWRSARRALHPAAAAGVSSTGLANAGMSDTAPGNTSPANALSRNAAVLAALGFTLLNPHFWLDMMLVGSIAHGFGDARLAFAGGALTASLFWLSALTLGARLLAPMFAKPAAWRVLDGGVAAVMWLVAFRLLSHIA